MLAHGSRADPENACNLGIRFAARDPAKDLALARGKHGPFVSAMQFEHRAPPSVPRQAGAHAKAREGEGCVLSRRFR
jgi:hypothetical protein